MLLIFPWTISAQEDNVQHEEISRILFYNVENLFHPGNDSLTDDDEFTPEAIRHWDFFRYREKLQNVYKTIAAAGGWQGFDLIGLCEIENRQVLTDLIKNTPLIKQNYGILHQDSEDDRGIDVALLYRQEKFSPLEVKYLNVLSLNDKKFRTRDILYTRGILLQDTIHVFVNHWPSRWQGEIETRLYRKIAARVLVEITDSIMKAVPEAKVIIMGDFNDEPEDASLSEILKAKTKFDSIKNSDLCNLSALFLNKMETGTYKYKGLWQSMDQFIVSASLLNPESSLYINEDDIVIFNPDFLLEVETDLPGKKPYRTYRGYRYAGGFSDHLPVCLTLHLKADN